MNDKSDVNDMNAKPKKQFVFLSFLVILLILVIRQVFRGDLILPQSLILGPLTIRFYGLFIALAVASGFYLAIKRSSQYGLVTKHAEDLLFWVIIGGFIGARIYHVLSSAAFYANHPLDIFKVWNGGLSIYGVIFGGAVAVILLAKNYKLKAISLLNWLAPSLIVGQIIGRCGNLFNYELYCYPTNLPWKMFVPEMFRKSEFSGQSFFHPLFLYEQLGLLILLWIIGKIGKSDNRNKGSLFLWYVLLYNILRIALEFLRIDSVFWQQIRINAIVSLVLVLASALLLYATSAYKRRLDS